MPRKDAKAAKPATSTSKASSKASPASAANNENQDQDQQRRESSRLRRRSSSRRRKKIWGCVSVLALVVAVYAAFFWPAEPGATGCPYLDDPERSWHDWCPAWCTWCPAGGHHGSNPHDTTDAAVDDGAKPDTASRELNEGTAADSADADAASSGPAFREFTVEELAKHDGTRVDEGFPLLLAINHEVFDVTEGARFYEPGAGYHQFAGRDSTRALALGSLEKADLTDDVSDFDHQKRTYNTLYIAGAAGRSTDARKCLGG